MGKQFPLLKALADQQLIIFTFPIERKVCFRNWKIFMSAVKKYTRKFTACLGLRSQTLNYLAQNCLQMCWNVIIDAAILIENSVTWPHTHEFQRFVKMFFFRVIFIIFWSISAGQNLKPWNPWIIFSIIEHR